VDKLREVYEKYKHLDPVLTDTEWAGNKLAYRMAQDLWAAIKEALGEK
jgi:hypothetical protein